MIPASIQTLIDAANTAVASSTGPLLADYWALGFYFIKIALGAVLGFLIAFWPIELVLVIIAAVAVIIRRTKNHTGRK